MTATRRTPPAASPPSGESAHTSLWLWVLPPPTARLCRLCVGVCGRGGAAWRAMAAGLVERVLGPTRQELHGVLPEADWVAVCCGLNDDTLGLFGAREFELMKPSAVITSVARGRVIDTDALVRALHSGAIGGAGALAVAASPSVLRFGCDLAALTGVCLCGACSAHESKTRRPGRGRAGRDRPGAAAARASAVDGAQHGHHAACQRPLACGRPALRGTHCRESAAVLPRPTAAERRRPQARQTTRRE